MLRRAATLAHRQGLGAYLHKNPSCLVGGPFSCSVIGAFPFLSALSRRAEHPLRKCSARSQESDDHSCLLRTVGIAGDKLRFVDPLDPVPSSFPVETVEATDETWRQIKVG